MRKILERHMHVHSHDACDYLRWNQANRGHCQNEHDFVESFVVVGEANIDPFRECFEGNVDVFSSDLHPLIHFLKATLHESDSVPTRIG